VVEEFPRKNVTKDLVEMVAVESTMVVEDLVMGEDMILEVKEEEENLMMWVEMGVNMMLIVEEVEDFVLGVE
jgi:hypothetical protein